MATKSIKILTPDFILSFKDQYKKTTSDLNQLFESINSSFISSTNKNDKYKNIKIVKSNKKSTNKWKACLNSSNSLTIEIKNILNKICIENFDKLSNELILEIKIVDYNSLLTLSNELFNRILIHPVYIDVYIKLILKIYQVTKEKWKFNNYDLRTCLIDMTQRKFYKDYNTSEIEDLNKMLKEDFLNNLLDIELEGLSQDEIAIKEKSMSLSNVKFITKMYIQGFIHKNCFKEILETLINLESKINVEALIEILNVFEREDDVLQELFSKLSKLSKKKTLDFRLKFIYEEALKNYNSKFNSKANYTKKTKQTNTDSKKIFIIEASNIIDEYMEIEEYEEIIEFMKESVNTYNDTCKFIEILFYKMICGVSKDYLKIRNLFKKINKEKNIKFSHLKRGFNHIKKNYSDIKLDYPMATNNINKFIKFCSQNKIAKKNYLEEISKTFE
ncbi:hypothetical protein CPAV1605_1036 [seawater metagenome]|uniref:MI domain-containing protein n=1 Tax=seawater metagenome TaxID=1561972 RepID=A0A5E8CIT2_9ZZZZ